MEEIRGNSPSRHVISFGRYIARGGGERGEEIGSSPPRSESVTFGNIRKIAAGERGRRDSPRKITFVRENIRVSGVGALVGRIISGREKDRSRWCSVAPFAIPQRMISKSGDAFSRRDACT